MSFFAELGEGKTDDIRHTFIGSVSLPVSTSLLSNKYATIRRSSPLQV